MKSLSTVLLAAVVFAGPGAYAMAPAEQGQAAEPPARRDRELEHLVQQMENACSSEVFARAPRIDAACPRRMAAVVKRGELAVPVLVRRIAKLAVAQLSREPMDDRGDLLVNVLHKLPGEAVTAAMVHLVGQEAVQRGKGDLFESLHERLRERSQEAVSGRPRKAAERAAIASKWQAWWDAQHPGQA